MMRGMTPPPAPTAPTATPRERAEAIVAGLPLADRIRLVSGRDFWTTEEIEGLVPSVMLTDGPHGLRKQAGDSDHVGLNDSVPATCFPVAATLACTWDPAPARGGRGRAGSRGPGARTWRSCSAPG